MAIDRSSSFVLAVREADVYFVASRQFNRWVDAQELCLSYKVDRLAIGTHS